MECERCHQRPATVYLTEIINNRKKTMRLCEYCAHEVQAESLGFIPQMSLHSFLSSLLDSEFFGEPSPGQKIIPGQTSCVSCGITESVFVKQGLLGCGDCYRYFGDRLEPVLRRIHGTTRHTGKIPKRTGGKVRVSNRIGRLKARLQEAISREEFEQAACLRDEIRGLEMELKEGK
jgi:protein arginine kinase activator